MITINIIIIAIIFLSLNINSFKLIKYRNNKHNKFYSVDSNSESLSDKYGGSELNFGTTTKPRTSDGEQTEIKCCYFDRSSLCHGSGMCPFDSRPCSANRNYFDDIYGNEEIVEETTIDEDVIDPDNIMQMRVVMENQMLDIHNRMTRRERRLRRQKLFLMANWLDDLLPDPTQGKSWMLNMAVDFAKIVSRATVYVVTLGKVPPRPKSINL